MPKKKDESKKGKPRSAGKRATKRSVYYAGNFVRNKLGRILRHNGLKAAHSWMGEHTWIAENGGRDILGRMLKSTEVRLMLDRAPLKWERRREKAEARAEAKAILKAILPKQDSHGQTYCP